MISPAFAQTAAAAPGPTGISLLPLILIVAIFYFFLIRPQQKKMREHQTMVKGLSRGDKVVTAGGIIGTIHQITDDEQVVVEISEGTRVKILRSTIHSLASKPIPMDAANSAGSKKNRSKSGGSAK